MAEQEGYIDISPDTMLLAAAKVAEVLEQMRFLSVGTSQGMATVAIFQTLAKQGDEIAKSSWVPKSDREIRLEQIAAQQHKELLRWQEFAPDDEQLARVVALGEEGQLKP